MRIRLYFDPETGQPHIANHDVDEAEVADVLARPGEDRPGREGLGLRSGRLAPGATFGSFTWPSPEGYS
jgi:hypothetical protein